MLNLKTKPQWLTLYLAGGCFWGVEAYFKQLHGVRETEVGYANGNTQTTQYEKLKMTDHAETVKIAFDAHVLSVDELLDHYFRIIDPTSVNRQGNDVGRQYRTGIYYEAQTDPAIVAKIQKRLDALTASLNAPVVVELAPLSNWVTAEDYHQDYLDKHPNGYCHVDLSLAQKPLDDTYAHFEKPDDETLRETLTPAQYHITQEQGTDVPHAHPLDQHFEPGIYVDIVSGEPLFSSRDKYDAGCGWPSFTRPIRTQTMDYVEDKSLLRERVEVRSAHADSHLGHVFDDGPTSEGGLRYCIDGSALRFVPKDQMKAEGYEDYLPYVD